MRLTRVTTKITSLDGAGKEYETLFLVDTGATDARSENGREPGLCRGAVYAANVHTKA